MNATLASSAYELLRSDIVSLTIPPGARISVPQLRKKYGMGATPIREALQRLTQEGLVQPLPRFGYLVTAVTLSDVNEMYELAQLLDLACIGLAVKRASDEELARIAEWARRSRDRADELTFAEFLHMGPEFHSVVAAASGNQRLALLVLRLVNELSRVVAMGLDPTRARIDYLDEHLAVAEALCDRDVERCHRLINVHYSNTMERIRPFVA